MRTPAGKECRYFYGNYFRGRNDEECRLLLSANPPLHWKADLCKDCPVPDILNANACLHLDFVPRIERPFPFLRSKVAVTATCTKSGKAGFDPYTGCGSCTELPDIFSRFEVK